MSQAISPSAKHPYGLARVCRTWRVSRATVYRHRVSFRRFIVLRQRCGVMATMVITGIRFACFPVPTNSSDP
jgi:putative transposase